MKTNVNLGSGNDYRISTKAEKWINVEKNEGLKADIHADLEQDILPIKDNSADTIVLKHVLEHIRNIEFLMDQCYRILKDGGTMEIICPYYTSFWAWGDPTHVRAITESTFIFWDRENIRNQIKEGRPATCLAGDSDFKIENVVMVPHSDLPAEWKKDIDFAKKHYNNVIEEVRFTLKAIK